ncbi:hypothetical protein AB8F75_03265 [Salmonella enterica]|uniref:hypothetical protein n=1 Tax=Salmonella enterica TaxID=28901 RepID=UPI00210A6AF4|nr:hypothetical protein [Salmonella enterica]MDJ5030212.1 hypothetical protein [Salmonella enterica]MDX8912702.1 hypothetical protein [Salmonella enterica]MDX8954077.1 hypothetical protein [Salmonella enterica]MDX8961269.1 hypothetical protein [Salmonella enterica]MDX8970370.1 hypothetical protein [Salmonella enterica]
MISGKTPAIEKTGKLLVAFSDDEGSSVGLEFAATSQKTATAIMSICCSTFGDDKGRLVTTSNSSDTLDKSSDGGDNMEKRLAILENEVAHIKGDVSELKSTANTVNLTVNSIDKNMAVVLERLEFIKDSLAKKPNTETVDRKISESKVSQIIWTIASSLTLISIASGIIIKALHQ